MNHFLRKIDNEKIRFTGYIESIDQIKKRKLEGDNPNFYSLIVNHRGKLINVKLDKYDKRFNLLTPEQQKEVFNFITKIANSKNSDNSWVEVEGTNTNQRIEGNIYYYSNSNANKKADCFILNEVIQLKMTELLRKKSYTFDATVERFISVDEIWVVNKKDDKTFKICLDLEDTSYKKLNKSEKDILNNYLETIFTRGKDLKVNATGKLGDTLFSNVKINDNLKQTIDVSSKVYKILDTIPQLNSAWQNMEILVSSIHDGDTIKFFKAGKRISLRLANIDSPEKNQPFGLQATKHLQKLLKNGVFLAKYMGDCFHGRAVAIIYDNVNGEPTDLCRQMVKDGMAYAEGQAYLADQIEAKDESLGMWVLEGNVLPKNHRKSESRMSKKI